MEELPGANTQRETRENLQEVITLLLEANQQMAEECRQGRGFLVQWAQF